VTYVEPLKPDANQLLKQLAQDDVQGPNIELLLGQVWRVFGGAEGLAMALHDDYEAATPGSQTRARITADIMKLVHTCSSGLSDGDTDDDLDNLEAEAKAQISKLLKPNNV